MVLEELGVLQTVLQQAVPIKQLRSENQSGFRILDLDYGDLTGKERNGLGIQRSTIYHALYETAAKHARIEFNWHSHIQKCDTQNRHAMVFLQDEVAKYDLCILASGASSVLADEHFIHRVKNQYKWGCMWTTIKLPSSFSSDILYQRCQRSVKMMGILPILKTDDGYKAALYWSTKVEDMMSVANSQDANLKHEISSFWPEVGASIQSLEIDDFIPAVYKDIWTPKPFKDRLIAIGDVSHATSPQLGQGCTMALLDSWLLAKCLNNQEVTLNDSLNKWWNARKYQLIYIRQLSRFLTPLYQSNNSFYSSFRDRVIGPLGHIPWVYRLQLKTLASEVLLKTKVNDC